MDFNLCLIIRLYFIATLPQPVIEVAEDEIKCVFDDI